MNDILIVPNMKVSQETCCQDTTATAVPGESRAAIAVRTATAGSHGAAAWPGTTQIPPLNPMGLK